MKLQQPFDVQTIGKLDAAIQQVEAAIELFYAKRYAPAITLAAAAEGCLPRKVPGPSGTKPLFDLMKIGAKQRYGKTEKEAVERFNRLVYWLKHETSTARTTAEVSNYDAWTMICRAVTKIEHTVPGSETPAITEFIAFSRQHYDDFLTLKPAPPL